MLAVHLENLLFLLLLVAAGLLQLLGRALRKPDTGDQDPQPKPSPELPKRIPRAGRESDQERVRRLLEALGQPPASGPPPPVAQRPTYRKPLVLPRVRPLGSPLPPLVTRPPDVPIKTSIPRPTAASPAHPFEPPEPEAPDQPVAVIPVSPVLEPATQPQIAAAQPNLGVRRFFVSPFTLRDAIIVREILGPPRSLRELELL